MQPFGQQVAEHLLVAVVRVSTGTEVGTFRSVLETLECGAEKLLLGFGISTGTLGLAGEASPTACTELRKSVRIPRAPEVLISAHSRIS